VPRSNVTEIEKRLNEHQHGQTGLRPDSITFSYAMEFLKSRSPRVLFISFDGTDHHAHARQYDKYLEAAHEADSMIAELWHWVQSTPGYKDETTLFITTDHGRGSGKNNWRRHSLSAPGSGQTWFAVIGPDTPPFGEMKFKAKYYQKQVAKTIAAFLGLPYEHNRPVGEVVQTMLAVPGVTTESITADSND
jgi:bisphosphoglycerate-independent phosphoglycerate mutase (AlkP superfamily)